LALCWKRSQLLPDSSTTKTIVPIGMPASAPSRTMGGVFPGPFPDAVRSLPEELIRLIVNRWPLTYRSGRVSGSSENAWTLSCLDGSNPGSLTLSKLLIWPPGHPACPASRASRAMRSMAKRPDSCTRDMASWVREVCWVLMKMLMVPPISIRPITIATIISTRDSPRIAEIGGTDSVRWVLISLSWSRILRRLHLHLHLLLRRVGHCPSGCG